MKRLIIAVDCDDVLVPTGPSQIAFYNDKYHATVSEKDFYESATMDIWGTNNDQLAIDRVMEHTLSEHFASIPPMPDAIDAITRLAAHHELHLVTGRPSSIEGATRHLLDEYFPNCFTSIHHTNYYVGSSDTVAMKRSKAEVCEALRADLFIDDYIGHVRDVANAGVCKVLLFGNYGWSVIGDYDGHITRCIDWSDVEREVERIANE